MKLSSQSQLLIESVLKEAVCKFAAADEGSVVTDIHIQPRADSGELSIFDDNDEELSRIIIEEWVEYDKDDFYIHIERILRSVINRLRDTGLLDNLSILKPYSFVLVDEDRETVSDLLLVDDDTLFADDELLKGLDEELDEFLRDLLEN